MKRLRSTILASAAVGLTLLLPSVALAQAPEGVLGELQRDLDQVEKKIVRKAEIPEGALTNSVQIVGRVLTAPMVAGQPFRGSLFAQEGGGVYLAASLPPGKRAISISLADWSAMAGLLYPGSVVDIPVSMNTDQKGSVSTTLLQGLHVIAIGTQSVAANEYTERTGARLVVVSSGDEDSTRAEGFRSIVLLDDGDVAGAAFGAGGTPMAVLLDAEGRVASPLVAGAEAALELARGPVERVAVV